MAKKFAIPFTEVVKGWYEFEAENLEEARKLVEKDYLLDELEPIQRKGNVHFEIEDLEEVLEITNE